MLPEEFLRHIGDAKCSLAAWDLATFRLVLRIEKEIGPENGLLILEEVSFLHLPPRFTIFAVRAFQHAIPNFPGAVVEEGEWLILFEESYMQEFYVIAQSARYERESS